jgi:hypothetical protein
MYNAIAVVIYQLTAAAKSGQKYAVDVVNAIRFMLVTSSTVDKDSSWMKTNTSIRPHHRTMMANMSKLALSAQTSPSLFMTDEHQQTTHNKILTESNELLVSIRNFVNQCQALKVPLNQSDPQWLDQPPDAVTRNSHRYSLQMNLAENLETMGSCIEELAETMIQSISQEQDTLSLSTQLFTHFKSLSNETSLFLVYLEDTNFTLVQDQPEYNLLLSTKTSLAHQVGMLFAKLQDFSFSSMLSEDLEPVIQALLESIRSICTHVSQLAKNLPQPPESPTPTIEEPPKTKPKQNDDAAERPVYLLYDYEPEDILFSKDGSIRGGTLSALVERLTLHDFLDMNFINNFLLTYRSFCSSEELLNLLQSRYNMPCPEGLSQDEKTEWEERKLKLVRLRVFNVIKNWLDTYYNEDDSVILDRLLVFTHTCIKKTLKFSNGQLESLIENRRNNTVENGGLKKMILTLPAPPEPILPKNRRMFRLLDLEPLEMARQLTIMDFKLYSAIRPIECLDKAWSNEESNVATNIRSSIEYCNQVTSWVSDVILSQHDIKKRSVLIKYWVQVAEVKRDIKT